MSSKPSISIIGFGRVGKALYRALKAAGYSIQSVYSRSVKDVDEYKGTFQPGAMALGELVFVTFSDNYLTDAASKIEEDQYPDSVFVHCSGTYSASIFEHLRSGKASFHPIQAVTDTTTSFEGAWFDMEADEQARKQLEPLAGNLGIHVLVVTAESKVYLHAASVIASNYLVTLLNIAQRVAEKGDIEKEQAIKALLPLMRSSLENIEKRGVDSALTGPVDRGEAQTVEKHLSILADAPALQEVYRLLAMASVPLSKSKDTEAIQKLRDLLDE